MYTSRELIVDAYYLSGVVGKTLMTVSGEQLVEGLRALNVVLSCATANSILIPFFKEYVINAVIGQEKYFIPGLIQMSSLTYNISVVRFPSRESSRSDYFSTARIDGINSLPFKWHAERTKGGINLYVYFSSQATYPLKIWGKFGLDSVSNFSANLDDTYEIQYIEYLKVATAKYICLQNNVPFVNQDQLDYLEGILINQSPIDFSLDKLSTLDATSRTLYYSDILNQGWRPV